MVCISVLRNVVDVVDFGPSVLSLPLTIGVAMVQISVNFRLEPNDTNEQPLTWPQISGEESVVRRSTMTQVS